MLMPTLNLPKVYLSGYIGEFEIFYHGLLRSIDTFSVQMIQNISNVILGDQQVLVVIQAI